MHYEVMILCVNLLLFCEFLSRKTWNCIVCCFLENFATFLKSKKLKKILHDNLIMGGYKMNIFNAN
jgi:energy-converting hydrogenase Eha subunit C